MKNFILSIWFLISWEASPQWEFETGPGVTFVFDVQVFDNKLYAVTDSVLYVKENSVWKQISLHGITTQSLNTVFAEGSTIILGTSNNGALISRDAGVSWSHFKNGLSDNSMAIGGFVKMDGYLYAATVGGGVYRSEFTQLTTWEPFNEGLFSGIDFNINSIYQEGGRLYISAGGNGYIYYRDKNSQSWVSKFVASILPEVSIFPEIISDGGILYAAGSPGLYMSQDRGDSWQRINELTGSFEPVLLTAGNMIIYSPLRLTSIASVYSVNGTNSPPQLLFPAPQYAVGNGVFFAGRLYIPTAVGLYAREFETTSVEPVISPVGFEVLPVYPNPFNSSGIAVIQIGEAGEYRLDISNLTGEVIQSAEISLTGGSEFRYLIEGEKISSGTYFLSVTGKKGINTQKFVVLK